MTLDISTLTEAGGFATFASGLFLLAFWWHERTAWTALWWGAASCSAGTGITLLGLYGVLPYYASNIIGPLMLDLGTALTLVASRIFNRGSVSPTIALTGGVCWIATLVVSGALIPKHFVAALGCGISGCVFAAAAREFWLASGGKYRGRGPLIGLLGAKATALLLFGVQYAFTADFKPASRLDWLGIIHILGLVYSAGAALFLVMMLKERSEAGYRVAALRDPLTGLANRRAFFHYADRVLARSLRSGEAVLLLAFDLDRFKNINDTFGHAVGDETLRIFAGALSRAIRPGDLAARLGGEEFVVLMAGGSIGMALTVAERVRGSFQENARVIENLPVGATVSVGVATSGNQSDSVADILADADAALYRAKNQGRNCVILAAKNGDDMAPAKVVPMAYSGRLG